MRRQTVVKRWGCERGVSSRTCANWKVSTAWMKQARTLADGVGADRKKRD